MKNNTNQNCLVIANIDLFEEIKSRLEIQYPILNATRINEAYSLLRIYQILCLIIQIDGDFEKSPLKLARLRSQFPTIPMIAISCDHDLELVRLCGEFGMDSVISESELSLLNSIIFNVINTKMPRVTLKELDIDLESCKSIMIREALKIIEKNYLELLGVQEIIECLEISEYTLSREFKKYYGIGPKRLLMHFKLQHALYLMQNPGLNLNEIAALSGFTNQRRFNECFQRVFNKSPSRFRKTLNTN